MSRKSRLTREQVIEQVGPEMVEALDRCNCAPTSRLQCDGDDATEYSASISSIGGTTLIAYYYTTPTQEQTIAAADGDGSAIDWTIHGYEIV